MSPTRRGSPAPVSLPGMGLRFSVGAGVSSLTAWQSRTRAWFLPDERATTSAALSTRPTDSPRSSDTESDRVVLDDNRVAMMLFGERNANLKRIEVETNARLHSRGNELTLMGSADAIGQARRLVEQLYLMARSGRPIGPEDVGRAAEVLRGDAGANLQEVFSDTILAKTEP